ncbi:MAG: protease complex subunit PrcB family protein [Candidatus Sericytochromatia bacterium]|nr:protease complex subunit PrcB family protein [Candidatus Sericytochromatia bacterium]
MSHLRYLALITLLGGLLGACGSRDIPSPTPSSSPSSVPVDQMSTVTLRPSIETQDALMAEVQRLEQAGTLSNVSIMESYPVQIALTGPADVVQRLQVMAAGSSNTGSSVSFESLSNRNSRRMSAGTEVVQSAEAWATLWSAHNGSSEEQPEVDFSRQSVLAVFAGEKPTGGYSIRITGIQQQGRSLVVSYSEASPGPDAMVTQVITAPAHLVRIDLSQQQGDFDTVSFQRQTN